MTDQDFEHVLRFIETDTGIRLPETNYQIVKQFLSSRMDTLHLSLSDYVAVLNGQRDAEYELFLDAITINETYFFREEKHFQVLEQMIFPLYTKTRPEHVMLWSAACSTGEEAVSLAALAQNFLGDAASTPYSVLASDVNPYTLNILRQGGFKSNSFREDGTSFRPLLEPFLYRQQGRWMVDLTLKSRLDIRQINLFRDDLSQFTGQFHVIFLRNMLVYMPMQTRQAILNKLVGALQDEGTLFLASSEMPLISHPALKLREYRGVYFFQKKTIQEKKQGVSVHHDMLQELRPPHPPLKRSMAPPVARKMPVDIQDVILCADQKLNNRLFSAPKNPNYALAVKFLRLLVLINDKNIFKARTLLDDILTTIKQNKLTHYFAGYIAMIEHRQDEALKRFRQAIHRDCSFWPARFYLAMLLRDTNPRNAYQEFIACQESIVAYIQQNRNDYQFLLEGFNAKYFQHVPKIGSCAD